MSRTKAINDYCKGCIYDQKAPGTWREQVEACRSEKTCPLWPYRPVSVATVNTNRKSRTDDTTPDIDSIVDSLPDEDEEEEALFVNWDPTRAELTKLNNANITIPKDNSGSMADVDMDKVFKSFEKVPV